MTRSLLSPRLVGRGRELGLIETVLARRLRAHAVAVIGDAGQGKSALLRSAAASVGGHVLTCSASRTGPPLQALTELAVGAVAAGADTEDRSLDGLRGGLGPLLGVPTSAGAMSGASSPALLAEALFSLLATLDGPVTCIVDDLHWADRDTLLVVERLSGRAATRPVALVMAARPGSPAETALRRLAAERSVELIDLEPLGPGAVVEMVEACLGAPAPLPLLDGLAACAGRPFFIEEFLRAAERAGVLCHDDAGWVLEESSPLPVPASVLDALRQRVDEVSPATRRILVAAAVLGEGLTVAAIAAAADATAEQIPRAIREGEAAQLLVAGAGTLTFRHALAVDALESLVTDDERSRLAARALSCLVPDDGSDGRPGAEKVVLAHLAEMAGDRDRAAGWRMEMARGLVARAAVGPALEQYDRALGLADDPARRVAARLERIGLLVLTGRMEEARTEVDATDVLVAADPDRTVDLAVLRAQIHAADVAVSRSWAQVARDAAEDTPRRGEVLAVSAYLEIERGEMTAAERLAREALATPGLEAASRCRALEVLGRAARGRSLDGAARFFRQATGVAEAHGLMLWRARALHELATIRQLRFGDASELRTARAAAVACGAPGLVAVVDFHIAAVSASGFDGRGALAAARRLVDLAGVLDDARGQAWGWMLCGFAHLVAGERPAAAVAFAESDRRNPGDLELSTITSFMDSGFSVLLAGDPGPAAESHLAAMRRLAELSETLSPLPPWYLGPLLLTVLAHPDAADARRLADREDLAVVLLCRSTLLLAEAVEAGRRGEPDRAGALAGSALEGWVGKPATDGIQHLALWLAAESASAAGWGDPKGWLFDAEAWATQQGLDGVAGSCRAQLRAMGATPKRRRSGTPVPPALRRYGLTGREIDVLGLLPAGLTNAAIAERLHIAPGTVKGYVEHLLAKTGATNRAALARLAAEHGLVPAAAENV